MFKVILVVLPTPDEVPLTPIELEQEALANISQSVVAFNLNVNRANKVLGFAGRGKVPKFHTIEPVAPNAGSKVPVIVEFGLV